MSKQYRILTAQEAADLTLLGIRGLEVHPHYQHGGDWGPSGVHKEVLDVHSSCEWVERNDGGTGRMWRVEEE